MIDEIEKVLKEIGILNTPNRIETVGDVSRVYELSGLKCPSCHTDNFFDDGKKLKKILDDRNNLLAISIDVMSLITGVNERFEVMSMDYEEIDSQNLYLTIEGTTNKSWEEIKTLLEVK